MYRLCRVLSVAALATLLASPAAALEGGFDCAEGADGEIEPYIWDGDAWIPNPDFAGS